MFGLNRSDYGAGQLDRDMARCKQKMGEGANASGDAGRR